LVTTIIDVVIVVTPIYISILDFEVCIVIDFFVCIFLMMELIPCHYEFPILQVFEKKYEISATSNTCYSCQLKQKNLFFILIVVHVDIQVQICWKIVGHYKQQIQELR
jgi:hypothetical protein